MTKDEGGTGCSGDVTTGCSKPRAAVIVIILAASSLTVMAGATIAPSLPGLARYFADTPNAEFMARLALTMPAPFIAFCAPFAGALVDRVGPGKVLGWSIVLYVLGGASGGLAPSLSTILVGRAVLGVGVAGLMTATTALIGALFDENRRAAVLGYQAAAMAVGGVVFLTLGGWLAEIDWRYPFWIYIVPVALIPFVAVQLPASTTKRAVSRGGPVAAVPWAKIGGCCAIAFAAMALFYVVPTQAPFLLVAAGFDDAALTGYAIAISTAATAVTAFFFGRIKRLVSPTVALAVMFASLGGGLALAGLAEGFPTIALAMAITGVGAGLILPVANSLVLAAADRRAHGRVAGALSTSVYLGQFVSPVAFALVAGGGIAAGFVWAGVVGAALALGALVAKFSTRSNESTLSV